MRTRRMFLRGAAGFTLALPFLESFAPRGAKAQAGGASRKRFVAFATDHGGIWQGNMYPGAGTLTGEQTFAGAARRRGDLAPEVDGGVARISPVLTASSSVLTPTLAAKLNVIRGLDVPFYLAHHRGGHLGNYAENDGNGTDAANLATKKRPTIDQVLAWSTSFYPDLATIKERSLVIGGSGMSANWSSPSTRSGEIQNVVAEIDSLALFNRIFVPEPESDPRPLIVDRVREDYQRLRSGSRLGAADKQRLSDHLDRLDELQRKLAVVVACGEITVPDRSSIDELQSSFFEIDPAAHKRFWQLMNDVVAAAFACDTCRVVTMRIPHIFSAYAGDWHQNIAHKANQPDGDAEAVLAESYQRFFEDVFMDLAAKLDAIDDDAESTVLDRSLVQWTHECGAVTHDPIELPVITAGSADGFFTTGSYVDYRDLDKAAHVSGETGAVDSNIGLVYNQWLGNVLQAMGLAREDFETDGNGGYGELVLGTETWYAGYGKYDAELDVMGERLPFLEA